MSLGETTLRPMRPSDVDEAVQLLAAYSAFDNRPQLRSLLTSDTAVRAATTAERAGAVVGVAAMTEIATLSGTASARVAVAEHARGGGLGTALAKAVLDAPHALSGIRTVTCALRDDFVRGRRFAERYGLAVTNHHLGWQLDLTDGGEELDERAERAAAEAGVRVQRAHPEADRERIVACALRSLPGFTVPFGSARRMNTEVLSRLIPHRAVVLLAESTDGMNAPPHGLLVASPHGDGARWYTVFTGVDTDRRRQGTGLAMKLALLAVARRQGVHVVASHTNADSEPIVRLNRRLGMAPAIGYWSMAHDLPDATTGTPHR